MPRTEGWFYLSKGVMEYKSLIPVEILMSDIKSK